jgi:hypothetical protein
MCAPAGTPLLADAALLSAYAFLPPAAVFRQRPGEPLVPAMARLAAELRAEGAGSGAAAAAGGGEGAHGAVPGPLAERRAALAALRSELNTRAREYLLAALDSGASG